MKKPAITSATPNKPSGLECPDCGCSHLPVHYTRKRNGHILRVRLCRHCGRRIVTREHKSEE